jgi:hypothetical protein
MTVYNEKAIELCISRKYHEIDHVAYPENTAIIPTEETSNQMLLAAFNNTIQILSEVAVVSILPDASNDTTIFNTIDVK